VVEARTPDEARAALANEPVDALLLDLHLGSIDALPFAAELRRDRPSLGIVVLSGTTDPSAASTTADAILPKPFELEAFRSAVALAAGRGARSGIASDS
jgi:DNA-binding response OmpR family regulator